MEVLWFLNLQPTKTSLVFLNLKWHLIAPLTCESLEAVKFEDVSF